MMLRASVEMTGGEVDLNAVTKPGEDAGAVVDGGAELLAFADAMVGGDASEVERCRKALIERLGEARFVEAAAVVANFQRMVRIADSTGIPLDGVVMAMSDDFRDELGINDYQTAGRTKPLGAVGRMGGVLLRRFAKVLLPLVVKRIDPEATKGKR